ncbi:MAG: bifunctional riboflavin kinase/FAD synthetase [Planctomycetales bacterium]|nr:bifunctional riboflavin kinase/FAD synthetase [Planctomycetales bacterium]
MMPAHVNIIRQLEDLPSSLRGGAVSIGNFDGVHRGHLRLCERLTAASKRVGGPAIAFTFDPHPAAILRPDEIPAPLTWLERKATLLGELGVDAVIAYPTHAALLQLSADEFFQQILVDQLGAAVIVEGPNFCFGRNREGTIQKLQELATARELQVEVVPPLEDDGHYVSSSRVRAALAEGDVAHAADLLTRWHRLRGLAARGAGRGAQLGFPTANLAELDSVAPAPGVYAGRGYCSAGAYAAAIHVGPIPTFDDPAARVEVHLIGHTGDLYGERVEVDFYAHVRDIRAFASPEELKQQLHNDVSAAAEIAAQRSSP